MSTRDQIEASISSEWYFTAEEGVEGAAAAGTPSWYQPPVPADSPLERVTICVLVLKGGLTVVGSSSFVMPENFDAQLGKELARKNAVESLIAYML